MQTVEQPSARPHLAQGLTAADVKISDLDNNSLILRLHCTLNHLSRWLTPVHDQTRLSRSLRRGEPSVKDLLIQLRDEERRVFPKLHLIVNENNPDLDRLPEAVRTPEQEALDRERSPLAIMAEFRRLRQSTCSLLRALPDSAWTRMGTSRREHDWQVRSLAEHLAHHDLDILYRIDLTLDSVSARTGVSTAARAHLDELLRLIPVQTRQQ